MKKRIAVAGQGKRGGVRAIVATKLAERWFFIYGFRKLDIALQAGEIVEVRDGDEKA